MSSFFLSQLGRLVFDAFASTFLSSHFFFSPSLSLSHSLSMQLLREHCLHLYSQHMTTTAILQAILLFTLTFSLSPSLSSSSVYSILLMDEANGESAGAGKNLFPDCTIPGGFVFALSLLFPCNLSKEREREQKTLQQRLLFLLFFCFPSLFLSLSSRATVFSWAVCFAYFFSPFNEVTGRWSNTKKKDRSSLARRSSDERTLEMTIYTQLWLNVYIFHFLFPLFFPSLCSNKLQVQ